MWNNKCLTETVPYLWMSETEATECPNNAGHSISSVNEG